MKSLLCNPLPVVKELFSIKTNEDEQKENDVLLMELGNDFCCYGMCNRTSGSIQKLKYYSLEPGDESNQLDKIISTENNLLNKLQQVYISSALPEAILIPEKYFEKESAEEVLRSTFNLNSSKTAHDVLPDWQVVVMYEFPRLKFDSELPGIKFLHHYSASLKSYINIKSENWISVHFTPKQFRVIVNKDQQLKLVQTYSYTAPLDVAYYLIKIFDEFSCSQSETDITVAGLIEEDSALFKELHKYFLNINFHQPASHYIVQKQYPQHFFSSMYNLAACVL